MSMAAVGLACQGEPTAPGGVFPVPTFEITAIQAPNSLTCDLGAGNFRYDPHFEVNPPPTTFSDPTPGLDNQCGDLIFDGRTKSFTTIYATATDTIAGENPWKYWWRRSRSAETGTTDTVVQARKVSRPPGVFDTANVAMPLSDQLDGIAAVLILTSEGSLTPTDSAFLDIPAWDPSGGINLAVQHWRRIPAPTLNSATADGDQVVLSWTNEHQERSIDSTIVFRDGLPIDRVGPTEASYTDTGLAPGSYTYKLKHFTPTLAGQESIPLNEPNTSASNEKTATVEEPPPPLAVTVSGKDLITKNGWYLYGSSVSGGTPPYGPYEWRYQELGTSTWTVVGTNPTYTRYIRTTDPWFWLRVYVDDATGDSAWGGLIVETWNPGGGAMMAGGAVGVRAPNGTCSPRPAEGSPGRQAWLRAIFARGEPVVCCTAPATIDR